MQFVEYSFQNSIASQSDSEAAIRAGIWLQLKSRVSFFHSYHELCE